MNKTGKLITDMVYLWLDWSKSHKITADETAPLKKRIIHANQCEYLANKRYKIIKEIDNEFDSRNN